MGPFSNNTPSNSPNNGTKLPVPDIDGTPQSFTVSTEPDNSLATKKWFIVTLISAGIMAAAGLIIFLIYLFVSNTSGYVLNAAMQNLVNSDGEAGTISYETRRGNQTSTLNGTFITYTDPTDRTISSTTVSFGASDARVSATARLFPDANYAQTAGMANLKRLIDSANSDSSLLTPDQLVRLSGLDGQWYTFTEDDVFDLRGLLPSQVQGSLTSKDIETIKQLYLKHSFLKVAEQLNDEPIEGANAMHLKISFDQPKLQAFLSDLKAANIQALQLNDANIQALQSGQAFGLDKATIEVWIARSDRTFRQIRITRPEGQRTDTLTLIFRSEQVAAQRQSVVRPDGAKSATTLVRGIQEILTTPTPTSPAQ